MSICRPANSETRALISYPARYARRLTLSLDRFRITRSQQCDKAEDYQSQHQARMNDSLDRSDGSHLAEDGVELNCHNQQQEPIAALNGSLIFYSTSQQGKHNKSHHEQSAW